MSQRTFFTADLHKDHKNVIQHCNRPFISIEEMNQKMADNWNSVVRKNDIVWVLGDFSFSNAESTSKYLKGLNGQKNLVLGNHDRKIAKLPEWHSVQQYAEIKVEDTMLVLFHYGMRVWNRKHYGALHLYGHSHGALPGTKQSCDVGVDCWNFFPVELDQIKARMATHADDREVSLGEDKGSRE